jgi:hypothetical protein
MATVSSWAMNMKVLYHARQNTTFGETKPTKGSGNIKNVFWKTPFLLQILDIFQTRKLYIYLGKQYINTDSQEDVSL